MISQPAPGFASMAALQLAGRLGEVQVSGDSGAGTLAQRAYYFTKNHKVAITLTFVAVGGWFIWYMKHRRGN